MHLGELEKLLLNYVWAVGTTDVKQAHSHFRQLRNGSLNTVQSALDRLFRKGLLKREKHGHAYEYSASMEKKAFIGQLVRRVTREFTSDGDQLLAAFASLSAELDEAQLDRLDALIQASRQCRKDESHD